MKTDNKPPFFSRLKQADYTPLLLVWSCAVFYILLCSLLHINPTGTSGYSTYTLQALAWRNGKISLGMDYPWLELAVYQGDWYVSFPPVPSIPLFLLTFFFDDQTPDHLLVKLYVLAGCLGCYYMLRHAGYNKTASAGFALLLSFATCLLTLTTNGAVWYQAQTLAFALTACAAACVYCGHPTTGLFLYALSVGCRPFNALYGPLLYLLYVVQNYKTKSIHQIIRSLIPGTLLGLLVASGFGTYNYFRFGDIFEFGHNYLP